jgi:hypothetical protein
MIRNRRERVNGRDRFQVSLLKFEHIWIYDWSGFAWAGQKRTPVHGEARPPRGREESPWQVAQICVHQRLSAVALSLTILCAACPLRLIARKRGASGYTFLALLASLARGNLVCGRRTGCVHQCSPAFIRGPWDLRFTSYYLPLTTESAFILRLCSGRCLRFHPP